MGRRCVMNIKVNRGVSSSQLNHFPYSYSIFNSFNYQDFQQHRIAINPSLIVDESRES